MIRPGPPAGGGGAGTRAMAASVEQWRLTPPPGDSPALDAGSMMMQGQQGPLRWPQPLAGPQVVSPPSLRSMLQPLGARASAAGALAEGKPGRPARSWTRLAGLSSVAEPCCKALVIRRPATASTCVATTTLPASSCTEAGEQWGAGASQPGRACSAPCPGSASGRGPGRRTVARGCEGQVPRVRRRTSSPRSLKL